MVVLGRFILPWQSVNKVVQVTRIPRRSIARRRLRIRERRSGAAPGAAVKLSGGQRSTHTIFRLSVRVTSERSPDSFTCKFQISEAGFLHRTFFRRG